MRYTEKEYRSEIHSFGDFYRIVVSRIIGSPLRLINEISLKVMYLPKALVKKILIASTGIGIVVTVLYVILMILTRTFSIQKGNLPLFARIICIIALAIGTVLFDKVNDNVTEEFEKLIASSKKPIGKPEKASVKQSTTSTSVKKEHIAEKVSPKLDDVKPEINEDKGINTQAIKDDNDLLAQLNTLDIGEKLKEITSQVPETKSVEVDPSSMSENLKSLVEEMSSSQLKSLTKEDVISYHEKETKEDHTEDSLESNKGFQITFSNNSQAKINPDLYYDANVTAYQLDVYGDINRSLKSQDSIYSSDELFVLTAQINTALNENSELDEIIKSNYDASAFYYDWDANEDD